MKKDIFFTACNYTGELPANQEATKVKTATTNPSLLLPLNHCGIFTEAIAGDHFTVVSMVPKGTSPETYDPTPQQLVDLAHSKAYFRIGYIGFEQNLDRQG